MDGRARGWLAFGLGAIAVVWSAALVLGAFVVPAYQGEGCQASPGRESPCGPLPSQTLFAANGWRVVVPLATVAIVSAVALWALHRRCAGDRRHASTLAAVCIAALGGAALVTGFSIGPFVLPVVLLLILSAVLTPADHAK